MINDTSNECYYHIGQKDDPFDLWLVPPFVGMVECWGGAFNDDANPSIKAKECIYKGYHYFTNMDQMNEFISKLKQPEYRSQGLIFKTILSTKEKPLTSKRTVAIYDLTYKDNTYHIEQDFGYEFPESTAKFMITGGNYSCDCNRSLFINREHGEGTIKELGCGYKIELENLHFEYLD